MKKYLPRIPGREPVARLDKLNITDRPIEQDSGPVEGIDRVAPSPEPYVTEPYGLLEQSGLVIVEDQMAERLGPEEWAKDLRLPQFVRKDLQWEPGCFRLE